MKLSSLIFGALAVVAVALSTPAIAPANSPVAAKAKVEVDAPASYIVGQEFPVTLTYSAPDERVDLDLLRLSAAAFKVNGKVVGERAGGELSLPKGSSVSFHFDLATDLTRLGIEKSFSYSVEGVEGNQEVSVMRAAAKGLNFMDPTSVSNEALAGYRVLLHTNRGDMIAKMYPHLAPNHVRNFLDLSYSGFYDGVLFHRVIPGFMIQGGDPQGTGMGNGPRRLNAEFSSEPHVRGILSMARTGDPNSASCQFFVMHATASHLNNQYSVFGMLESGFDTLDAIVMSPKNGQDRPNEDQKILSATVLAPQ